MPQTSVHKATHLDTGRQGEELAAAFLRGQGLKIIERNWRPGAASGGKASALELDIVASERKELVFVEVKSRTDAPGSGFSPLDAFNPAKRGRVLKAATFYLEERGLWNKPCRFDLVCIVFKPGGDAEVEHHKNVISFEDAGRGAVGGGNAPWQPW